MITKTIKSKYIITEGKRIDGKFFLNNDALLSLKMKENENKCSPLSKFALVFNPPVFKRQFCQNTPNAVQYFQSSDVPAASEQSSVFINKKQAEKVNAIVKENQILVTGFGTIGNVRLVSKLQEGVAYANNTCRIEVNHNFNYGFIYAFMASKYGKAQLNNNGSGSVVRYIETPGIKRTLIPIFPENKQLEIHNLIVESAELRVEANKALAVAHNQINDILAINDLQSENIGRKSLKTILKSHNCRFEANYFQSKGYDLREKIIENYNFKTLGELTSDIFRPGIFKRTYVEKGTTFLGGSDITKAIPDCEKKLSKTKTQGLSDLMLKKHWILITCGGTIGNMAYVDFELEKCAASQHILRIVSSKVLSGYLFAFLSSNIGKEIIQSYTYGSVIPQIEPHHISGIPIPIFNQETEQEIHELVMQYVEKFENSKIKELQAIQLVENEIEQWQH